MGELNKAIRHEEDVTRFAAGGRRLLRLLGSARTGTRGPPEAAGPAYGAAGPTFAGPGRPAAVARRPPGAAGQPAATARGAHRPGRGSTQEGRETHRRSTHSNNAPGEERGRTGGFCGETHRTVDRRPIGNRGAVKPLINIRSISFNGQLN